MESVQDAEYVAPRAMPKRRIICQAVWRPGEPWPYCMCQQRSLPGEDYCAKHMPDDQSDDGQVPGEGEGVTDLSDSPSPGLIDGQEGQ